MQIPYQNISNPAAYEPVRVFEISYVALIKGKQPIFITKLSI